MAKTAEQALHGTLTGKTAIVTGATSGIGVESARVLAKGGAHVVLAVRNTALGAEVAARLGAGLPPGSGSFEVCALDLTDLTSVRAFVDRWRVEGKPLHVLLNNAGVMATPHGHTKQGFETQVGTNHIGHFVLTTGLLPFLEAAPGARVVTVSSDLHKRGRAARLVETLESDHGFDKRKYVPFLSYGDSKLANVLFAKGIAKRAPQLTSLSLHPGVILTGLSRSMGAMGAVFRTVGRLFMKSVEEGAATSIWAATAPELAAQSGAYLSDCAVGTPSSDAQDEALADRVWALSERAVA